MNIIFKSLKNFELIFRQLFPTTILPPHKRKTVDLTNELYAHLFDLGEPALPYGTLLSKNEDHVEWGLKKVFEFVVGKDMARKIQSRISKLRAQLRANAIAAQNAAAIAPPPGN